MSVADLFRFFPFPGGSSGGGDPSSSDARPRRNNRIAIYTAIGVAKATAFKLAVHRASAKDVEAAPPCAAGVRKPCAEAGCAEEKSEKPPDLPEGLPPPLRDMPIWARRLLGSMVMFLIPLYKKMMRMEDEVEKTVETVVGVAEEVAKMTEHVVTDLAEKLPDGTTLKKVVVEVEAMAETLITEAEKTKSVIEKVDEIKGQVNKVVKREEAILRKVKSKRN